MTRPSLLVINGPNLNMLGRREPTVYGSQTLQDVETLCHATGAGVGLDVICRQSNHEGEIVTWVQESRNTHQGIVINAGAYTHTSIALHDALKVAELPIVEVHISNVYARESFRHHSYISPLATGVICGLGIEGYAYAITALAGIIAKNTKS